MKYSATFSNGHTTTRKSDREYNFGWIVLEGEQVIQHGFSKGPKVNPSAMQVPRTNITKSDRKWYAEQAAKRTVEIVAVD